MAARFSYVNGATIQNLNVAGTVTTTGNHGSGLVGAVKNNAGGSFAGSLTVNNVKTSVAVAGGGSYQGGFVGHHNYLTTLIVVFKNTKWRYTFYEDQEENPFPRPRGRTGTGAAPGILVPGLTLDDDTTLWTGEALQPGEAFTRITLTRALDAGEYPATLHYDCYTIEDNQPLNGAEIQLTLEVK